MPYNENNKLCLVLTCDRPYYEKRRQASANTYSLLKKNGFTVVFLYANPLIHYTVFDLKNEEYRITVPMEDTYKNIPAKILTALKFLSRYNISGILKIDDDTTIIDPSIFNTKFTDADYAGASVGSAFPGVRMAGDTPVKIEKQFMYFGGPFYWISSRAIKHVVETGFKYPWEDASVGYAITEHFNKFTVRFLPFNDNKQVIWSNNTEVDDQE